MAYLDADKILGIDDLNLKKKEKFILTLIIFWITYQRKNNRQIQS
jgi:hypothetical protein